MTKKANIVSVMFSEACGCTGYVCYFVIYAGAQTAWEAAMPGGTCGTGFGTSTDAVLSLVYTLLQFLKSGKHSASVFFDNFYGRPLVALLLADLGIGCLFTVSANAVGICKRLIDYVGIARGCCVTAWCGIMRFRGWNDNSIVRVCSTIQIDEKFEKCTFTYFKKSVKVTKFSHKKKEIGVILLEQTTKSLISGRRTPILFVKLIIFRQNH